MKIVHVQGKKKEKVWWWMHIVDILYVEFEFYVFFSRKIKVHWVWVFDHYIYPSCSAFIASVRKDCLYVHRINSEYSNETFFSSSDLCIVHKSEYWEKREEWEEMHFYIKVKVLCGLLCDYELFFSSYICTLFWCAIATWLWTWNVKYLIIYLYVRI